MTPVFGLETDESLAVETVKKEYDQLKANEGDLSDIQQTELKLIKQKLKQTLPKRDVPVSPDKATYRKAVKHQVNP